MAEIQDIVDDAKLAEGRPLQTDAYGKVIKRIVSVSDDGTKHLNLCKVLQTPEGLRRFLDVVTETRQFISD